MRKTKFFYGFILGITSSLCVFLVSVMVQSFLQKPNNSPYALESIDEVGSILQKEEKNQIIPTQLKEKKIGIDMKVIEKIFNKEGYLLEERVQKVPSNWINKTEEEVKDLISREDQWKIESFSEKEIVLSKKSEMKKYHYILMLNDKDVLVSYTLDEEGKLGNIDETYQNVPLHLFTEEQAKILKTEGKRFESREELHEFIQSFHG